MSTRIFLIVLLIVCSAFFSCSETALFSLSRSEVARFKRSKNRFAKGVIEALAKPRQLLVSILLGNELVNVAIAVLVAAVTYEMLGDISWQAKLLISICISTPIIVVLGEVIPKNIGIRYSFSLAATCAFFIRGFSYILTPARRALLKMADWIVRLSGGKPEEIRSMIMEEEFRRMIDMGCDEGAIAEDEVELMHHVFDLADITVEQIMTPKEGIMSFPLSADIDAAMSQVRAARFSRIPIYDTGPDDIVGILHIRDLISILRKRKVVKIRDVENIIRPAYFAPLTMRCEEILKDFQKRKVHMAVIIDEQRRPAGVVTMEDIFGALFEGN